MIVVLGVCVAAIAAIRGLWSPCGLSMLSSLNPVSERARGNRFWITAGWYVLGAVAGGAGLGSICASGAWLVGRTGVSEVALLVVASLAAVCCVASDLGIAGRSLPVHPRQVDERWLAVYRRWIYAAGYGVQIGFGFATYIMTSAVYLTAALAVLSTSWSAALLVGVVFGAVRGLLIVTTAFTGTPEALRGLHRRLAGLERESRAAAVLVSAVVAVIAAPLVATCALAALGVVQLVSVSRRRRTVQRAGMAVVRG